MECRDRLARLLRVVLAVPLVVAGTVVALNGKEYPLERPEVIPAGVAGSGDGKRA